MKNELAEAFLKAYDEVGRYIDERNAAVLSLDLATFKAFANKYGVDISDRVLEITMYKMAYNIESFPPETKKKAADWLKEHGYSTNL